MRDKIEVSTGSKASLSSVKYKAKGFCSKIKFVETYITRNKMYF